MGQIGPPTTELAAMEGLKNPHIFMMVMIMSLLFPAILLILAGNEDMPTSSDKLKIWQDLTPQYKFSCH